VKTIEIEEGFRVPLLTVRDMLYFTDRAFDEERKGLMADLDAAGVSPEVRLQELREHSKRKGSAAMLVLAAFRITIATEMVQQAIHRAGGEPEHMMAGMRPDRIVDLAKSLIGYEPVPDGVRPQQPVQPTA
jgi:hypothetical protein